MCYSAQIERDWRKYLRVMGPEATLNLDDFIKKYWWRVDDPKMKMPKAIDAWFADPKNDAETKVAEAIKKSNADRLAKYEKTVFEQRKRVADAERKLQVKVTKKAQDDVRIGTDNVQDNMRWIADIKRSEIQDKDARMFPGWYVPVIMSENGRRTITLMRYQCRPHGKPKFFDQKFGGTYNARRDSLGGFWKDLFGFQHGIMIANAFFENVETEEKGKRRAGVQAAWTRYDVRRVPMVTLAGRR